MNRKRETETDKGRTIKTKHADLKDLLILLLILIRFEVSAQTKNFKVLVLAENGGHHIAYSTRAKQWLDSMAIDSNFSVTYISDTKRIDKAFLPQFSLFIQLDYPPYG